MATVTHFFSHSTPIPAIGQGTWYMGENATRRRQEVNALQRGIDLGLTLIVILTRHFRTAFVS